MCWYVCARAENSVNALATLPKAAGGYGGATNCLIQPRSKEQRATGLAAPSPLFSLLAITLRSQMYSLIFFFFFDRRINSVLSFVSRPLLTGWTFQGKKV